MKIVAFAASSSRHSINKQIASYAAGLIDGAEVEVLDLNDYELPLFSVDKEAVIGQPDLAKEFLAKLSGADAIIISFAEHNGSYSAAYKNLFDWCSRITREIFAGKPVVLFATSPGPGGASRVLKTASTSIPIFAGHVKATLSIPKFNENFDVKTQRPTNDKVKAQILKAVETLL
jgi:NAD(P)H-dependent FMN reductase